MKTLCATMAFAAAGLLSACSNKTDQVWTATKSTSVYASEMRHRATDFVHAERGRYLHSSARPCYERILAHRNYVRKGERLGYRQAKLQNQIGRMIFTG